MTYKKNKTIQPSVLRIEDNTVIPFDPANIDYQVYLKFLSEGNEPLPADEPQPHVVEEAAPIVEEVAPVAEEATPTDEPSEG
jgi:hypothetical protein